MTEQKKHISATQLIMMGTCQIQYWFRYVNNVKAPPGIAQLKGSAVHGGAKENFHSKKKTREDLPRSQIIEISVNEFEMLFKKAGEISPTPEEAEMGIPKAIGQAKDSVSILSGLFADKVAPCYQPVLVEEKIPLSIPKSQYDLLAVVDLADDQDVVMDLKTGVKAKPQKEVEDSLQLSMYALVFKALTKRLPKEVRLETLVHKKEPDVQRLISNRDLGDLELLVRRINRMVEAIEKKVFQPTNPTNWQCSERWCGYAIQCPFYKHGDQEKKKYWLEKLLDEQLRQ